MDKMCEKVEGMKAQIEEYDEVIRSLHGDICLLENDKAHLKAEIEDLRADCRFQCGKIAAYENVLERVFTIGQADGTHDCHE